MDLTGISDDWLTKFLIDTQQQRIGLGKRLETTIPLGKIGGILRLDGAADNNLEHGFNITQHRQKRNNVNSDGEELWIKSVVQLPSKTVVMRSCGSFIPSSILRIG